MKFRATISSKLPMIQAKVPRYGFHPSSDRGYLAALKLAVGVDAGAVQMWMGSNKGYACKKIPEKEYRVVAEYVAEHDLFFISHSPYILNFARPLQETAKGIKALERYLSDLVNITNLGGVGSVLHMGSNVKAIGQDLDGAYKIFVDNLQWIVERKPKDAIIILENMAGGGTQMCTQMAEWSDFWNNYVTPDLKKHIRWCVDTAHLFAAGEYNLSSRAEVMRFYRDFDREIGWRYVLCIHFNGSKSDFGSRHDCHHDIGPNSSGYINTKGLRQMARIAGATEKPMILEVPLDVHSLQEQFYLIDSWFST